MTARDTALACLQAVESDDAYANLVMPRLIADHRLDARDAAFATELAYGTLRMKGLYDAIIAHAAKRSTDAIDSPVRDALRLGTHQVLAMRVPVHAAVSETVTRVRRAAGPGAAKFANAVMRRVTERDREAWLAVVAGGDSREALAVRHSHPAWVVGELDRALAADGRPGELTALLETDNAGAQVTLVARPGLVERDELIASLLDSVSRPPHPGGHEPEESPAARTEGTPAAGRWAPTAVTLPSGTPGTITAVREGRAAVQDEGSQLAALTLARARPVKAGERWLDMCAGPGGKAALLGAEAARHDATLDALELHSHRATLVEDSTRAIPPGVVTVSTGDARSWGEPGTYDRIMLDAPCTGLGALRRRPEARWRRTPADVTELQELQHQLLASATRLLAPGGVIAYVTCSPVLAETQAVVAASGLRPADARLALAEITGTAPGDWGSGPHIQLWPHAHGTDAMYISLLTRP